MSILTQLRTAHDIRIKFNVSLARWFMYQKKDNGFGVLVNDTSKPPTITAERIRLSHEAASVPSNTSSPVGLSTSFSMFVEMYYNSVIMENDVLIVDSVGWKVGPVDSLKVTSGDVYGKHAPLVRVNLSVNNMITSFKIGTAVGVINNTLNTILVKVPAGSDVEHLTPVVVHGGKLIDKTGEQDFTGPVEYTVTAENMIVKTYTVTVEVLP